MILREKTTVSKPLHHTRQTCPLILPLFQHTTDRRCSCHQEEDDDCKARSGAGTQRADAWAPLEERHGRGGAGVSQMYEECVAQNGDC